MDMESVHDYCRSLPHSTENVQWGDDLCFRVADKIFAVMSLDPASPNRLSLKCAPERFEELLELDGIVPAPYMARNKWVALRRLDAVPPAELRALLRASYDLVYAKLPKRVRVELEASGASGGR
jgi:predicted DNA-binding protein (MmcQ/YjbR family)